MFDDADFIEIIQERAGDISFAHDARRIYDQMANLVKKRMWAVLKPNIDDEYLSRWNGVHVSLPELGVTDVPEELTDLVLTFVWGTPEDPVSSAFYLSPRLDFPSGIIGIGYNLGKSDRQPFKLSKAAKRARNKLRQMSKNSEMEADMDIIQFVPRLLSARRTAFIHELRHAYDQTVRDDEGQMSKHMDALLKHAEDNPELDFIGDDEMNAYITNGIEDTIEDFVKNSRNKPTKAKAKKWAPNATILWNKFLDNVSGGVKHYAGEEKLLKRAAARLTDVWDDYVENLNEQHVLIEAMNNLQLVKIEGQTTMTSYGILRNGSLVGGAEVFVDSPKPSLIDTLWATDATSAYALLMSILFDLKSLIPGHELSPASAAIIKRWYDKYADDPEYVRLESNYDYEPKHLQAVFLAGPDVKPIATMIDVSNDQKDDLEKQIVKGFHSAYNDPDKTKITHKFNDLLKNAPVEQLLSTLDHYMQNTGHSKSVAKWLRANVAKVDNRINDDVQSRELDHLIDYARNITESRKNIIREIDEDLDDEIIELMKQPEFASIVSFAEMKFDDDEESYGTAELQALARNLYLQDNPKVKALDLTTAPSVYREKVKKELEGWGLRFEPRKARKAHRGFSDPFHGSNRYAGNHGGSGFENSYNRTPSSQRTFDPNDSGALGMGSKRRR